MSVAKASASSGVCLYLNVSRLPGAAGGGGLVALALAAAGAEAFFTGGAVGPDALGPVF